MTGETSIIRAQKSLLRSLECTENFDSKDVGTSLIARLLYKKRFGPRSIIVAYCCVCSWFAVEL